MSNTTTHTVALVTHSANNAALPQFTGQAVIATIVRQAEIRAALIASAESRCDCLAGLDVAIPHSLDCPERTRMAPPTADMVRFSRTELGAYRWVLACIADDAKVCATDAGAQTDAAVKQAEAWQAACEAGSARAAADNHGQALAWWATAKDHATVGMHAWLAYDDAIAALGRLP